MTHTEKLQVQLLASFQAKQVELYNQHLEGKFDWSTMSLHILKELYEHNLQETVIVPAYIDWLLDNKDTTLHFTSSGSFLTALKDIDNFITGVENITGRELTSHESVLSEYIFRDKLAN